MGAAIVAARDERCPRLGDPGQRRGSAGPADDARRVRRRPDQEELVVHHFEAFYAETLSDKFFLGRLVMDEQHIGVAILSQADGLPGADRENARFDPAMLLKYRQNMVEQTGILGRACRRDDDKRRRGPGRWYRGQQAKRQEQSTEKV